MCAIRRTVRAKDVKIEKKKKQKNTHTHTHTHTHLCGSSDVYFCVRDGGHLCTFSVLGLLMLEHAGVELCVVVETSAGQCG